jgi:hypothetical protein
VLKRCCQDPEKGRPRLAKIVRIGKPIIAEQIKRLRRQLPLKEDFGVLAFDDCEIISNQHDPWPL